MKNLVTFATEQEAYASIKDLEKVSEHFYRGADFDILITGVGCLNAALSLSTHCQKQGSYRAILNLGIAGAIHPGLELQTLHGVARVDKLFHSKADKKYGALAHPSLHLCESGLRLVSCDAPVHDIKLKELLRAHYDLVDMEGYGLALACQKMAMPFEIVKVVSDFASEGGSSLIQEQLKICSQTLAELLTELFPATV